MPVKMKCHMRAGELVGLLKVYGPFSFRALSDLVDPPAHPKRLHDSLVRLYRKGIIQKRMERTLGDRVFYQIVQDSTDRIKAARILKCAPEDLHQPHFRYRELLHTESCGLWAHKLRQVFPEATIIRDYEFAQSNEAQEAMLTDGADKDLTPDILMILPKTAKSPKIRIAVEVESTRKSTKRLRLKLRKYALKTITDGVIYLCEPDGLKDSIAGIAQDKVLASAERVKHYGNYFFMFLIDAWPVKEVVPNLVSFGFQDVPLNRWIMFLQSHETNFRRNSFLEKSGTPS